MTNTIITIIIIGSIIRMILTGINEGIAGIITVVIQTIAIAVTLMLFAGMGVVVVIAGMFVIAAWAVGSGDDGMG